MRQWLFRVFVVTLGIISFFLAARPIQAGCSGSIECCISQNTVCQLSDGTSCQAGEPGCTCTTSCGAWGGFQFCSWTANGSGGYSCTAQAPGGPCLETRGSCSVTPDPQPTPPPSNPPPAGCQSSWCTSPATCASTGGSSSSGAGYCSNPSDVRCCPAGGGGGWTGCIPQCNPGQASIGSGAGHCDRQGKEWIQCAGSWTCQANDAGSCVGGQSCCNGLVKDGNGNCQCPVCQPACTPACGQIDGCGGICGNANAGGTGTIASTTPANGGVVTIPVGQTTATISWAAATKATKYDLLLYPQDNPTCSDPRAICTQVSTGGGVTGTSYNFTVQASKYYFYVRGVNTTCLPGGEPGAWSSLIGFSVNGPISGTVYNDPTGVAALSGALCVPNGGPGTGVQPGAGSVVNSVDSGGSHPAVTVSANGTYSTVGLFNTNTTVTLVPGDATYTCTCPVGCSYGGILPPQTGINYYVSSIGGNWFQSSGGDVGTGGKGALTFADPINLFCTEPTCQPYPMIAPVGQTTAQIGALYSYTGSSIDVSQTSGNQNSPVGPAGGNFPVKTQSALACRENYDYFYRLYSMGPTPAEDFVGPGNPPDNALKPSVAPVNARAYFRDGNLTISSNWTLAGGESVVIFVNGNLNVTNNAAITVPTTAFLSFLVKGNITFDPTVGTTPSATTGTIQGVYVANGNMTVQSIGASPPTAEKKFVGEGVFAVCGDIDLPRDFRNSPNVSDGINNNRYPSALFVFRPDVITNTPDRMKRPLQNWREVAP